MSEHADANIHHAAAQALAKVVTAVAIPVLEQQLQAEPLESVIERITEALDVIRQKAR
ncbi:MAG: hypothetical protein RMM08_00555 [Armatimonadota bacterium]|nr:hypothetical protein [bacterium]MDW8319825.1 hypothetical protein [Armatimonadota bacterium]